ncbi:MAG: N-6 DNA methylase [Ichthyobacteriaceae bacterium]|nr:N-6 DNA methylase [Ichthyobacteriaceae bacterium]
MSLFQPSVLKKYINNLDDSSIEKSHNNYRKFISNKILKENIKKAKYGAIKVDFINELFCNILGYTLNTEVSNQSPIQNISLKTKLNTRKADAVVLLNNTPKTSKKTSSNNNYNNNELAVIKFKSNTEKDFETIRKLAFNHKSYHPNCTYVILSTYDRLRFYIDNSIDFIEFNLFGLDIENFKLLYLLLAEENILNNVAKEIKDASFIQEQKITKKLYADYSLFKHEVYSDIVNKNLKNPEFKKFTNKKTKKILFQKTQKLLDRFLFAFFGEDRGLLPAKSTSTIIDTWDYDLNIGDKSLYCLFKEYFEILNNGRAREGKTPEIFAYKGGLFNTDDVLNNIIIDDEILRKHVLKLSAYNFENDVDVNILGHIFENSLNDIESVYAQIDGVEFDIKRTKRKQEGIFYTPKYITKYIVDNTVGKLCKEKKEELNIIEYEYAVNKSKAVKERLNDTLNKYRNWLLQLTIIDPACGSGAFLNQTLGFLINEHQLIDELSARLFGGGFIFPNIENHILEKNIYGVDINDESVEITKLSLWLRTAHKGQILTTLNNNIKCGNSLIDSKPIAKEKAFDWKKEFPEVFEKGGFDVVIGNPPYGIFINTIEELYYKSKYPLTSYKINLYILFIERMLQLFNKGLFHFIIPKSLLFNTHFEKIRKELLEKTKIHEVLMLSEKVFSDAEVGGSLILKFEINSKNNNKSKIKLITANKYEDCETGRCPISNIEQLFFLNTPNYEISHIAKGADDLIAKLRKYNSISNYYTLKNGLNPGNVKHILISDSKDTENHKPIIWGREFSSYNTNWGGQYINYDKDISDKISVNDIKGKQGMKKQSRIDFALRNSDLFETDKLIVRKTGDKFVVAKDTDSLYFDTLTHGIYANNGTYSLDFLLAVLNSNLATSLYRMLHDIKGKVFAKISLDKLGSFPLPEGNEELRKKLADKAVLMTSLKSEFFNVTDEFITFLQSEFSIKSTSNKVKNWHKLNLSELIKELNKAKTGAKETVNKNNTDLVDKFETKKEEIKNIENQINNTNNKIDSLVYELYKLTENEIKIVEL